MQIESRHESGPAQLSFEAVTASSARPVRLYCRRSLVKSGRRYADDAPPHVVTAGVVWPQAGRDACDTRPCKVRVICIDRIRAQPAPAAALQLHGPGPPAPRPRATTTTTVKPRYYHGTVFACGPRIFVLLERRSMKLGP